VGYRRSDWSGGLRTLLTIAVVLLGGSSSRGAAAEPEDPFVGTLFVRGEDGVALPAVALSTDVEIQVSGLVARARVTQTFFNDTDLWLEGIYVFPLPEMAAVDALSLRVGQRRIEGRIQERQRAKRTYQRARKAGKAASLLEQERPNLFTTSVANIPPWEEVDVTIEYQQTLHYDAGAFELRFPMTLTPRYVPGGGEAQGPARSRSSGSGTGWSPATGPVSDAPRITPPLLQPGAVAAGVTNPLDLRVVLDVGFSIRELTSPTHAIDAALVDESHLEVWVHGVPADRDFVLRWVPWRGHEPSAAIFSEERGGEHYALLMLLPPEEGSPRRIDREAVFVVDTSGSMGGRPILQARRALRMALERLAPGDTFNVIAFASGVRSLFLESRVASEANLQRADEFVDGLDASGGTEMMPALELALRDPLGDTRRLRQVIFITDGSIGNEDALFAAIQRHLGRSRLFMVGIGAAPNAYFLNRAAVFGRGTATSISGHGELRERMEALFAKIESPMLRDLTIHWNDEVEVWPQRLPDLYAGEPVLVTARLQRFVGEVRVFGRRGEAPFELSIPLTPGEPERGIHKLWARRKIAHWMQLGSAGLDPEKVRDAVLSVALDHGLVSKFTSLVAVDVTPLRPRSARGACTNVAGLGPAGSDPSLLPGLLPQGATPAPALVWLGSGALLLAAGLWREARKST
jgi:Ca-activated chloride channel family protein